LAVAKPIPLVPPVTTEILFSTLPDIFTLPQPLSTAAVCAPLAHEKV
jgi:hypothetical protein